MADAKPTNTRYWILPLGGNAPLSLEEANPDRTLLQLNAGDGGEAYSSLRERFEERMATGDRVIIMPSPNAASMILHVVGAPTRATGSDSLVREVQIVHRFEPPFMTVAHLDAPSLLSADSSNHAKWILKEVLEAASGDGFTVDWSPLVNYF